jgi:hypothetical protein
MHPFFEPLAGAFLEPLSSWSFWFCSFHHLIVSAMESGPVLFLLILFFLTQQGKPFRKAQTQHIQMKITGHTSHL